MSEPEKNNHFAESASPINAPAPWELQGNGYICLLRCPLALLDHQSFIPKSLQNRRQNNSYALMMFVDYVHSPVGPYHELLFIPGRFTFADGRQYFSISRIFVSSMDSVVNGRRNWGIPKEIAEFAISYDEHGMQHVKVTREGTSIAELTFRSWPVPFPFTTTLLPKAWHTLGQHEGDVTFLYRPEASGWLRPARLIEARIDETQFPPIKTEQVIAAVKITYFQMHFPEAEKQVHQNK